MARVGIKLHLEGVGVKAGAPAQPDDYAGWSLTLSVEGSGPVDPADVPRKLLCPWLWDSIQWTTGVQKLDADPGVGAPLEAYLDSILASPKPETRLRFRVAARPDAPSDDDLDSYDEEAAGGPTWPGLLAQLARLGSEISRPLGLAHAIKGGAAALASITAVHIGGKPYPILAADDGQLDAWFSCEAAPLLMLPPGQTGLIDHETRLVEKAAEAAVENWLIELPVRLGRALDPLSRLVDIVELPGTAPVTAGWVYQALTRALPKLIPDDWKGLLANLLEGLDPDASPADKDALATRWAAGVQATELRARLLARFYAAAPAQPLEPADAALLRQALLEGAADQDVRVILEAALAAVSGGNAKLLDLARDWTARQDEIKSLWRTGLPSALARNTLFEKIASALANNLGDWDDLPPLLPGMLIESFDELFGPLPRTAAELEPIIATASRIILQPDQAFDRAGKAGLTFKTDSVFAAMKQPTDIDLHLDLDGCLVAIAQRKLDNPDFEPFQIVTVAEVEIEDVKSAKRSRVPGVVTPRQISFESMQDDKVETRHSLASYMGEAMIPWSDRELPTGSTAKTQTAGVRLLYRPSSVGVNYPALAYGQDYLIACGYQAQGALLPVGFGGKADPWRRDVDNAFLAKHGRAMALRRTQVPSAPQLWLTELRGDQDDAVQPLWREHMSAWGSAHEQLRRRLRDAKTLYLDALPRSAARSSYRFEAGAAKLALGKSDRGATNSQVWRYWLQRDEQWSKGKTDVAVPPRPATEQVDDPAVIGDVRGTLPGKGGIRFLLWPVGAAGPGQAEQIDARLAAGERVAVTVSTAKIAKATIRYDKAALRLTVVVPLGERFVLEARTMCDARFLPGAAVEADIRFDDSAAASGTKDGDIWLFGSETLAIESLPTEAHLPAPAELWNAITIAEAPSGALVASALPTGNQWDYVKRLDAIWQSWVWDGGPVQSWRDYGLGADVLEMASASDRDPSHTAFEQGMFVARGFAGESVRRDAVSGLPTHLLEQQARPNRGADYLRLRLTARSRYASLRARADPDAIHLSVSSAMGAGQLRQWRGYTISARRQDLPSTPRLSVAVPLFSAVDRNQAVGAVGLYLDGPAFSVREGGGLDERLLAELLIEELPSGTPLPAVGLDPIFTSGRLAHAERVRLECRIVVGQTLEPTSAAPQIPFTLAILELKHADGEKAIPADAMASIRLRRSVKTPAGDLASEWTNPLWVHFLDETESAFSGGGTGDQPVFAAYVEGTDVVVTANPGAPQDRLGRLLGIAGDTLPLATAAGPWLVRRVHGLFLTRVTGATGDAELRTMSELRQGIVAGPTLRFPIGASRSPTHLRLIEVQHVVKPGGAVVATLTPGELFSGADGNNAGQRSTDADVEARIGSIGPLIPVVGSPN